MDLYESRYHDITPWPLGADDMCRLGVRRYYVKKRRTLRRTEGQNLRYQFIASSEHLTAAPIPGGHPNRDPIPLQGEPDHFASQYGWIFCEMGVIMGLEMRLHARYCGIEEKLVSLCTIDNDVNPGLDINLNLRNIMPDNSPVVNTQTFRNLIDDNCFKFIEGYRYRRP